MSYSFKKVKKSNQYLSDELERIESTLEILGVIFNSFVFILIFVIVLYANLL